MWVEDLIVSQISPYNAPFGKRTTVFSGDGKMVSTLRKNPHKIDYFPCWAERAGIIPWHQAGSFEGVADACYRWFLARRLVRGW
jgi:hypothetical protein